MRLRLRVLRPRAFFLATAVALGGFFAYPAVDLPDVEPLAREVPAATSYMRWMAASADVRGAAAPRTEAIGLDHVSVFFTCGVIKAEDGTFFRHRGVNWKQTRRGLTRALRGKPAHGGSTITQQTARNLFLTPERTISRKLREAYITRRLERELGKRRVLELYVNVVQLGDTVWGTAAASRHYFGKPAAMLDAFEGTFLTSLVAAPSRPLVGAYRVRAEKVQRRVLAQLYWSGLITRDEWRLASARTSLTHAALESGMPLAAALQRRPGPDDLLIGVPPRYVPGRTELSQALEAECGLQRELRERKLREGW